MKMIKISAIIIRSNVQLIVDWTIWKKKMKKIAQHFFFKIPPKNPK